MYRLNEVLISPVQVSFGSNSTASLIAGTLHLIRDLSELNPLLTHNASTADPGEASLVRQGNQPNA
jgi:hypothetical protein